MKINYECASCMLRQSRDALELATDDENLRMDVTIKILSHMYQNFKKGVNSNKLGTDLHHITMDETNNHDPYKNLRENGNKTALKLVPEIKKIIKNDHSLENYVKIAVAGNMIDFGAFETGTDFENLILKQLEKEIYINDVDKLDEYLKKSERVLYLADNAGEIVFDKLLIQKIKTDYDIEVILALKEAPIVNDAILDDAKNIKLDKYATLITTGSSSVGVVEKYVSDEFKELLNNVDFIISKGMGNFEGLTEMNIDTTIFYLLTSKCNVVSREINVPLGSVVVLKR